MRSTSPLKRNSRLQKTDVDNVKPETNNCEIFVVNIDMFISVHLVNISIIGKLRGGI